MERTPLRREDRAPPVVLVDAAQPDGVGGELGELQPVVVDEEDARGEDAEEHQGVHLGPGHLVVVVLRHHDLLHARVLELAGLGGGAELLAVMRGRHQLAAVAGLVVGVAEVVGVGRGGGRGGHGPVHCHAAGHSLTTHTYGRLVLRSHCPFST